MNSAEISRRALLDSEFQGRVRLAMVQAALANMGSTNPQVVTYSMRVLNGTVNMLNAAIAIAADSDWATSEEEVEDISDADMIEIITKPSDPTNSVFHKLAIAAAYQETEV
jgi:hypothetical protein